jgi:hypothetical protein
MEMWATTTECAKIMPMSPENIKPIEGSKRVEWILGRIEKKLVVPAHVDFPEDYRAKFIETVKNPNVVPFIYSNHYDHANGLSMAIMSNMLTNLINNVRSDENPFNGFLMPVSKSILNGKQGSFMKDFIDQAKTDFFLDKYRTHIIGCTTKNDREKRDTNESNVELMLGVARIARDGNGGIAIFPEASVEGGRRIKEGEHKGQRKGLQEFNSDDISKLVELIEKRLHKELLYIPLGLSGPNLLHTDHRLPTVIGMKSLTKGSKGAINIRVGEPITHTEMINKIGKNSTKEDICNHLRGMVAVLLPANFLPPVVRK